MRGFPRMLHFLLHNRVFIRDPVEEIAPLEELQYDFIDLKGKINKQKNP